MHTREEKAAIVGNILTAMYFIYNKSTIHMEIDYKLKFSKYNCVVWYSNNARSSLAILSTNQKLT